MQILATTFSAVFGIGLLLGLINLLIWRKLPGDQEFLFAAVMAMSAGLVGLCEAVYLRSPLPADFNRVFEMQNIAIGFMLISMVWFVYRKLRTGRVWLAWAITCSWTLFICLGVYRLSSVGSVVEITELQAFETTWGEVFYMPTIPEHPLMVLAELTTLAIVLFVLDASIQACRRGRRGEAIWVGGAILFFILIAGVQTPLVDRGIVQTPYMISLVFIAIVIALTVGLVNDIARNASLTRQLALERDRWDELLNTVQLAVTRIGTDGKIGYVNPYFEAITGWQSDALVGMAPDRLFPPDKKSEVQDLIKGASNWSSRAGMARPLLTASGGVRDMIWFSVALRDEQGAPAGIISFGQDVTDQYAAQAERDLARRELEKLSRALTMGEMASAFAHELSQPIAAVLSNAQTLEILQGAGSGEDDEKREILDDIIRETRRARDLMNRIRAFIFDAKPEKTLFDFGDLVAESLDILRNEALKRSVIVSTEPPADDLQVHAARTELQQVVFNIVLNAFQAVENRERGEVRLSWKQTSDDLVELKVEDNGDGLSPELSDTVMTAFVTTKDAGSGIGLAICRRVARRHGGDIRTGPSQMGGAQFRVLLDILPTDAKAG